MSTSIDNVIRGVASRLSEQAHDTVMHENIGKHRMELQLALRHLPENGRMLDLGGGVGINLLCLRPFRRSAELVLVDRFEEYTADNRMGTAAAALALLHDENITVSEQDFWPAFDSGYPADHFDLVTCFDVIEHLPGNPLPQLRELFRITRPGGRLLLAGPNAVSLMKRLKLVAGIHPYMPFTNWLGPRYFEHFREYTPREYSRLAELAGFRTEEIIRSATVPVTRFTHRYFRGRRPAWSPIRLALAAQAGIELLVPALRHSVYVVALKS